MKIRIRLCFVLPALLFLAACNKYEDGPALSFRSAEKRLMGKWEVDQTFFDNQDQTEVYRLLDLDEFTFNIFSDWSEKLYINITGQNGDVVAQSDLSLSKDKKYLMFRMEPMPAYETDARRVLEFYPVWSLACNWDILRLRNKQLWIRTGFDSGNYEIHFNLVADFTNY